MFESLRGLRQSLDNIIVAGLAAEKLSSELEIIKQKNRDLFLADGMILKEGSIILDFYKSIKEDLLNLIEKNNKEKEKSEKLIKCLYEKIKLEQEEKLKLNLKVDELSEKIKELDNANESLIHEIAHYKKTHKVTSSFEEVQCKNCKKMFNFNENFNWSCKTHLSAYNGKMYWCCGKTEKNSQGCIVSKHRHEETEEKLERNQFCSNCKCSGHICRNCPMDPNAKSKFDPKDEHERIIESKKRSEISCSYPNLKFHIDISQSISESEDLETIKEDSVLPEAENKYKIYQQ